MAAALILKRLNSESGLRATILITALCDPVRRWTCRHRWLDRVAARLFPTMCYYDQFPDLDPRIVRELNELDTHDALTDFYKHLRTMAEIRDYLESLNLKDVECWEGGNGVEARARV